MRTLHRLLGAASPRFPVDGVVSIGWYCPRSAFLGLLRVSYVVELPARKAGSDVEVVVQRVFNSWSLPAFLVISWILC